MLEYYFAGFKMQVTVFLSFSGGYCSRGTVARADYCSNGAGYCSNGKIHCSNGQKHYSNGSFAF